MVSLSIPSKVWLSTGLIGYTVPFVIWGFFKIITPFIDPQTRQKLKFNEDLRQHVPPEHLMKSVGGDVEFRYEHSVYWPALNQLADKRKNQYHERWVQGGKQIGEYENYLKTGKGPSLLQKQDSNGVDKTQNGENGENGEANETTA